MSDVSVVTLNKGRDAHLRRLAEGIGRGAPPRELVVVQMGPGEAVLPPLPCPVRRVAVPGDGLPLAAARNAGRRAATGDTLVFLDVDCIPSATLVPGFASVLAEHDALVCCAVRYLPAGAVADGWTEDALARTGRLHPARRFPDRGVAAAEQPGLFWSLAFGIRAASFDRVGGFDEAFSGYGAEDTDFAFRAAATGLPLLFAGGLQAFHQHHAVFDPPLQHFADIVRNARLFRDRHGLWPMDGWLDAFARMGLIAPDRSRDLAILRHPERAEIDAARLPPDRVF